MSDDRAQALRRQVEALSESQRQALAEALANDDRRHALGQLVGFIVPRDGTATPPETLRSFLAERLPEHMIPGRFVTLEDLPRTPAGKLDRPALARAAGHTPSAAPAGAAPGTEIEARLAAVWREVLKVDDVGIDDDFFEIGGDSLSSIRVIARAGRAGIRISPERFFERPTIRHMAAAFASATKVPADGTPLPDATGEAPLTPIQHWFLEAIPDHRDWWNQSYLLELGHPLDAAQVREIMGVLVRHHAALRLRLVRRDGRWIQEFLPPDGPPPIRVVRVDSLDAAHRSARLVEEGGREHASLAVEEGRLFRCLLFEADDGWRRVLLLGHHLVLDGVSWNVILDDFATLVMQAVAREPLRLAGETAPARAWAIALAQRASAPDMAALAAYWLQRPAPQVVLPENAWLERPGGPRGAPTTYGEAAEITLTLGADESRALLQDATRTLDASVQALLLTALLTAWHRWSGSDQLRVDVEGHGRDLLGDALDVSRTVGWFTTVFPLTLALPPDDATEAPASLASVASAVQRALSELPLRGAAHGLLRYLAPDERTRDVLAAQPRPALLFNHLGTHDVTLPAASRLRVVDEPHGRARSPAARRPYPLELNSRVEGGVLVVTLEYARDLYRAEAIEAFVALFRDALASVAASAPARFGWAGVDASALATVAGLLEELDES